MSLNKVILIGNVGKDPDVRYFEEGRAIANFSIATNERGYKLANGTEVPERTEWHNIVVSRDRAQFVERYVKKGSLVYVEGKIRYRDYDDKDGNKRYVTEIVADRVEFYDLGRRPDGATSTGSTGSPAPAPQPAPAAAPPSPPPASDSADDLPF
ncbi:MAG: single-stranded DNA-binding protein [Tannerella sp.]|jgi:single-strand DNA-binding protein|nr:single-stranded DNA-binding protein [Tannerella sp.]